MRKKRTAEPYTIIDHTADIGVRVTGGTLPQLFENSALALFHLLAEEGNTAPALTRTVTATGGDRESLLVNFLNELLHLSEEEEVLFCQCRVATLTDSSVTAEVRGETFDEKRHERSVEIKTTTYHQLRVEKTDGRWEVTIIFDI